MNATNDSKEMETGKVKLDLCRVSCPIDCTSVNSVSRHAHVQVKFKFIETTFIKNHFRQKPLASKTTFIKNHFRQKPLSSTKTTFINKDHFHQKTNFIRNHFHQKPFSSETIFIRKNDESGTVNVVRVRVL